MKKHHWFIIAAALILLGGSIFLLMKSQQSESGPKPSAEDELSPEEIVKTKYGIPVDSFNIIYDTVLRGNTLSDLLVPYKVSPVIIDKIGKMANDTFRIDRIRAGQPFALFCTSDTAGNKTAKYMVYENNGIDYTVYDFRDSVCITKGEKPVDFVERNVCGTINSSLWMALKNQNTNTSLALTMSEMFGWVIDFFGIQKGDEFRIIYEEAVVEGKPLYVERIKAGMMVHMGREYWAIPFAVDSVESFYELDGASLRRTFLKAPLKYNRISSRYTHSRFHPIFHKNTPHLAVDYSAPTGTPIRTIGDGVITLRRYGNGAGNYVKVRHNAVYTTVYMHMSRYGEYHVGDRVKQGDIIGYVGSTGWSTGPHLHFEVHKNGVKVDPLKVESPPADPVPDSLVPAFKDSAAIWREKIEAIACPEQLTDSLPA
jgi:murein DD-endopeptidase MepM/ murein hydrolase activator NlpD